MSTQTVSRETYERIRAKVRTVVQEPGSCIMWGGREWSPEAEGVIYAPSVLDGKKPHELVTEFKAAGLIVEPMFYPSGKFYGFVLTERNPPP